MKLRERNISRHTFIREFNSVNRLVRMGKKVSSSFELGFVTRRIIKRSNVEIGNY